jgi:hypothetical protein
MAMSGFTESSWLRSSVLIFWGTKPALKRYAVFSIFIHTLQANSANLSTKQTCHQSSTIYLELIYSSTRGVISDFWILPVALSGKDVRPRAFISIAPPSAQSGPQISITRLARSSSLLPLKLSTIAMGS